MKRNSCFLLLAILAAIFFHPGRAAAAACGENTQPPCERRSPECFTDVTLGVPYCGFIRELYCNYSSLQIEGWWNKTCIHRNKGAGLNCCATVNYTDPYGHSRTSVVDGYYAKVDLREAWIIVPNQDNPARCATDPVYKNAVMSVNGWAQYGVYNARLMINANFFDPAQNPYLFDCNNALGLTVSNKTVLSPNGQVHGYDTASLIFFTPEAVKSHGFNALISSNAYQHYGTEIQNAISGFWLLQNGSYVIQPGEITPNLKRPRAAVGLSDGNSLILVVVNPGHDDPSQDGGTTLHGLADFMKDTLHVKDALTLDGSGSAQFYYHDPDSGTTVASKPSDTFCPNWFSPNPCYRPVPVFLGIQ